MFVTHNISGRNRLTLKNCVTRGDCCDEGDVKRVHHTERKSLRTLKYTKVNPIHERREEIR